MCNEKKDASKREGIEVLRYLDPKPDLEDVQVPDYRVEELQEKLRNVCKQK